MKNTIISFTGIILVLIESVALGQSEFDPRDMLKLQVIPNVVFQTTAQNFSYRFSVTNLQGPESLSNFKVEVGDNDARRGGTIINMKAPSNRNWSKGTVTKPAADLTPANFADFNILWGARTDPGVDPDSQPSSSFLKPGDNMEVSFESKGLPSVKRFWGQGWVPAASEDDLLKFFTQKTGQSFDNLDEVSDNIFDLYFPGTRPWFINAFQGQTVAPEVLPANQLQPIPLVQRLISLKDQALSLGWIDNKGVANSLDQKLKNALDNLNKGDTNAASGILGALMNELDAQHGKHVNDNAFFLLKANVQFILSQLNS